jgi:hypothetical protein
MKRYHFVASLALTALVVVGFAKALPAGALVPFKGSFDGDVTVVPAPPSLFATVDATGHATHLGQFTLKIPHLVNPGNGTAHGFYTFTAADGDEVFAEFWGNATTTDVFGVLSIVETATITGGTGRFAGATGSFTTERLYDRIAGTTEGTFAGSVSSPGANRP